MFQVLAYVFTVGYKELIKLENYKSHMAMGRLDEFGKNILNSNQSLFVPLSSFCPTELKRL